MLESSNGVPNIRHLMRFWISLAPCLNQVPWPVFCHVFSAATNSNSNTFGSTSYAPFWIMTIIRPPGCIHINHLKSILRIQLTCWYSNPWRRHQMKTFSSLLALFEGNPPVTGLFPSQRPVTRSFDVFYLRLNKRLIRRWFETPSHSLWRDCNVYL